MFGWLKNLFGKKEKKEEAPAAPETVEMPAEREVEQDSRTKSMEKMAAREKELSGEPNRPERPCPKCGAPNDDFVSVCWMCKEPI